MQATAQINTNVLERWLKTRPQGACCAVVLRAAHAAFNPENDARVRRRILRSVKEFYGAEKVGRTSCTAAQMLAYQRRVEQEKRQGRLRSESAGAGRPPRSELYGAQRSYLKDVFPQEIHVESQGGGRSKEAENERSEQGENTVNDAGNPSANNAEKPGSCLEDSFVQIVAEEEIQQILEDVIQQLGAEQTLPDNLLDN